MIRPAIFLIPGLMLLTACSVDVPDRAGLRCDTEHACSHGRLCVSGLCVDSPAGECDESSLLGQPNLIGNPSFEADLNGWKASGVGGDTLERVPGGKDRAWAVRAQGPDALVEYGINDHPNWLMATAGMGTRYCLSAWVRADGVAASVRLKIREYENGTQQGRTEDSPTVTVTPAWTRVSVVHVTLGSSASTLDLQAVDSDPRVPGARFLLDDFRVQVVP
jgi:hypothetical protein